MSCGRYRAEELEEERKDRDRVSCACGDYRLFRAQFPYSVEGMTHWASGSGQPCAPVTVKVTRAEDAPPAPKGDQGLHKDAGKPAIELIPPLFLLEVGAVMEYGAQKYSRDGWRGTDPKTGKRGMEWRRLIGSAFRHLTKWAAGEELDLCDAHKAGRPGFCPECSGLHHLAHLGADAAMLYDYVRSKLGVDDRWSSARE